jgi:hypothetical protein
MNRAALSGEKEILFGRYHKGEISFDDLSRRVYEIDHPARRWPLKALWFVMAAFLPLLFVGSATEHHER